MNYLAHCRVEKGKTLLLREAAEASVTDVAFACGFDSSPYFATVFKRTTGMTPSQFRQQQGHIPPAQAL